MTIIVHGTAQELFDKVAAHLLRQGLKSTTDDGDRCLYMDDRGHRCAVGCLLEPSDCKHLDGYGVTAIRDLIADGAIRFASGPASIGDLLEELQSIHDDGDPATWQRELAECAIKFGLTFTTDSAEQG